MSKYRVIQWGSGFTGEIALRYLITNKNLELAGLKCYTPGKEGVDAGEIAGLAPMGLSATRDIDQLLSLQADCVIFMPRDALADPSVPGSASAVWVAELEQILRSGHNVISPICSGTHYRHMAHGEDFRARLQQACEEGKSTLFFTGLDPGFTDVLAFNMTSGVADIRRIDTWEMVEYGGYSVSETLRAMGFALAPEDVPNEALNAVRYNCWGGVPYAMAEGLGVEVEGIEVTGDVELATESFVTDAGMPVAKGTIAAMRFTITGLVDGEPLINVHHVNRLRREDAPHWPSIGRDGGYVVEIDSFPPLRGEFALGLPGGTGAALTDGFAMTAARCVNCVSAVIEAEPGYRRFAEMPVGGRHGFRA
ncbi:NAD(P)H-dependent amine dehydrogenase family protein [Mycobacterium branderi]|uniref:Diacylglycerol kinase n=1 Tax=Mycobacterium branderi TaxID=43348 RepID=A0A7I7WEX4_9MYCO|nr:hypothetical protein [Mycobacterium branderi]MCV7234627.1 hypothetical protein [Mycobacterium branderi]ORA33164.1 hypothetical protein BST20_23225 [Mycobacterium branderi]BBZ15417.1 diacylglycerol kinase [Mycobacterium branderi]